MSGVDPTRLVGAAVSSLDPNTIPPFVVAAGKAAGPMYRTLASIVRIERAVVTAPAAFGSAIDPAAEVFDAGHPAPNVASLNAAERSLDIARTSATRGGLLVLLSGGASAMLAAPAEGLSLEDKVDTARRLMAAGAAIHELNCVRKHLSRIKGGRLAAAAGRTLTLALSDVHGPVADDPSVIASGPTVPDDTTFADALSVIRDRGVTVPRPVSTHLDRGARGEVEETVKPGDRRLVECVYRVIGNRVTALQAAERAAVGLGYHVAVIPEATSGEARAASAEFVARARKTARNAGRPLCIMAAGETTVTVRGNGLGGRNQEFALAAAPLLTDLEGPVVLGSAGTDGIDGPTFAAGAIVDTTTLARAAAHNLDIDSALARNDSCPFFEGLDDLIVWGPTGTNVGDLHVMLID